MGTTLAGESCRVLASSCATRAVSSSERRAFGEIRLTVLFDLPQLEFKSLETGDEPGHPDGKPDQSQNEQSDHR